MTGYAIVAVFAILYFSLSAYFISKENEVPSFVRCFFILVGSTVLSFVITCVISFLLPAERFESDQPYAEQIVSTSTEQMDTNQNQILDSGYDYIITVDFNMEYNHHVGNDWLCSAKVERSHRRAGRSGYSQAQHCQPAGGPRSRPACCPAAPQRVFEVIAYGKIQKR